MANNKIIFGDEVLIDLTQDDVQESAVLKGITFHRPDGEVSVGECEYSVDASECNALPAEVLAGRSYAVGATVKTGTMANYGGQGIDVTADVLSANGQKLPKGYYDGANPIQLQDADKIIPENIRAGVTILGVAGEVQEGVSEDLVAPDQPVTPYRYLVGGEDSPRTIAPPYPFRYFSTLTLNPIPCSRTANAFGGTTVVIGAQS